MGGEKTPIPAFAGILGGSPPRGRGKVPETYRYVAGYGITPAWAGKRTWNVRDQTEEKDHPRVGGEKSQSLVMQTASRGSPPRGRGKGFYDVAGAVGFRITPAWAGKSYRQERHCCFLRDHPRVGGEKDAVTIANIGRQGSPPRGRGKAEAELDAETKARITPAWAGKRSVLPLMWRST